MTFELRAPTFNLRPSTFGLGPMVEDRSSKFLRLLSEPGRFRLFGAPSQGARNPFVGVLDPSGTDFRRIDSNRSAISLV